jgi:uncharacterized protein (TIGR02646 family)
LPEYDWKLVQKLAKKTNPLVLWGRTTGLPGNFKRDVTKKLTQEQCERCAYCGCYLFEEFPHRDHIAPKESYSQWTFLPENLVLACYACNTDSKKTYNPVLIRKAKYKKCTFRFVHPYLDNPNHHLEFVGAVSGVIIRKKTFKGEETIKLFGLASPERTKQRAKDALSDAAKSKLHGQWLTLFEDVTMSKAGMVLVPR